MSWCNCSTDGNEFPAEFHNVDIRRARKQHKCCECRNIIAIGEQYEHVVGKWDGQIGVFKTCLKCLDIRKHFFPDGWLYGGMDELLWDTINTNLSDIRSFWLMDEKDKTIAGLIELVEELLAEIGYKDDTTRNLS